MAFKEIIEKITSDAQKKAEGIVKDAQEERKNIEKETLSMRKEVKQEFEIEMKKSFMQKEDSFKGGKRQELNVSFEAEKRRIIEDIFSDAAKEFVHLSSEEYEDILSSQVVGFSKDLENVKVLAPEKRKKETLNVFDKLGAKPDIEYSKEFNGGIKVAGDGFEYDLTFEKIMQGRKKELEAMIAGILFGDHKERLSSAQKEKVTANQ